MRPDNRGLFGGCRECRAEKKRQAAKLPASARVSKKDATHCPNGHPYSGDNLIIVKTRSAYTGKIRYHRKCRQCEITSRQRRKQRRKALQSS